MARKRRSAGEGSSWKRSSDGRWVADWYDHTGRRRYVTGATQKEARGKAATLAGRTEGGERTIHEFLDWWCDVVLEGSGLAPETIRRYRSDVRLHLKPALSPRMQVDQLKPRHVREVVAAVRAKGLSKRSAQSAKVTLGVAYQVLVDDDELDYNPVHSVKVQGPDPLEVPDLSPTMLRTLLVGTSNDRFGTLYAFLVGSGVRPGEALGLGRPDVDFERRRGVILRNLRREKVGEVVTDEGKVKGVWAWGFGDTKTHKPRPIPLSELALAAVARRLEIQDFERSWNGDAWVEGVEVAGGRVVRPELIWTTPTGKPVYESVVSQHLERACERLDLPRLTPNMLRHAANTVMAAGGVETATRTRMLGHSARINERVYTHVLDEQLREAAQRLDEALGEN